MEFGGDKITGSTPSHTNFKDTHIIQISTLSYQHRSHR